MKDYILTFEPNTHTYELDGKVIPSVTQLLEKHHISPCYNAVDPEFLKLKADRGTYIHKEIEKFIHFGTCGISDEYNYFVKNIYPRFSEIYAETMCHTEEYAGCIDFFGTLEDGRKVICDTKTGTVHKDSVSWQLSLYRKALTLDNPSYQDAELWVYDAKESGNSRFFEVQPIKDSEIEKLLEAERNGELYNKPTLDLDTMTQERMLALESQIAQQEEQLKALKSAREECLATVKEAMEQNQVTEIDAGRLHIKYVAPTVRAGVDTAKMKKEAPDLYQKFYKETPVSSSLRVTIREVAV